MGALTWHGGGPIVGGFGLLLLFFVNILYSLNLTKSSERSPLLCCLMLLKFDVVGCFYLLFALSNQFMRQKDGIRILFITSFTFLFELFLCFNFFDEPRTSGKRKYHKKLKSHAQAYQSTFNWFNSLYSQSNLWVM